MGSSAPHTLVISICASCAVCNEQAGIIDNLRTHCEGLQHDKRDLQEDKKDLRKSNRELRNELSVLRAQVRNNGSYQKSAKVSAVVEGHNLIQYLFELDAIYGFVSKVR